MADEKCPHCGIVKNGNGNGNGVKKDIEHQEELGKIAHQKLENDISRVEKESQYKFKDLHREIDDVNKNFDSKYKFVFTTIISIIAIFAVFTIAMHDQVMTEIYVVNEHIKDGERIIYGNDAILDALIDGKVRLTSEINAEHIAIDENNP